MLQHGSTTCTACPISSKVVSAPGKKLSDCICAPAARLYQRYKNNASCAQCQSQGGACAPDCFECAACPAGGRCDGTHVTTPKAEYWMARPHVYQKCLNPESCKIGRNSSHRCTSPYTGPLCAQCSAGYGINPATFVCQAPMLNQRFQLGVGVRVRVSVQVVLQPPLFYRLLHSTFSPTLTPNLPAV